MGLYIEQLREWKFSRIEEEDIDFEYVFFFKVPVRFSGRLFEWTVVHKYTKESLNHRNWLGNLMVINTLEGDK